MNLPRCARDRALAALKRLSLLNGAQFRIKKTHVGNIFESKFTVPEGGLRLLFVYGETAVWCIGAFVKHNDEDGNRKLLSYLKRSEVAERL